MIKISLLIPFSCIVCVCVCAISRDSEKLLEYVTEHAYAVSRIFVCLFFFIYGKIS